MLVRLGQREGSSAEGISGSIFRGLLLLLLLLFLSVIKLTVLSEIARFMNSSSRKYLSQRFF
jgi:hypothetical protein